MSMSVLTSSLAKDIFDWIVSFVPQIVHGNGLSMSKFTFALCCYFLQVAQWKKVKTNFQNLSSDHSCIIVLKDQNCLSIVWTWKCTSWYYWEAIFPFSEVIWFLFYLQYVCGLHMFRTICILMPDFIFFLALESANSVTSSRLQDKFQSHFT